MTAEHRSAIGERLFQLVLIASTFLLSWLGMMVVHEFGHVLFAWLSGGAIAKVVLHPLEFSRTDLSSNPHPLFVAWGGALVGAALPLGLAALWRILRAPAWFVVQFFAGFCLIANGSYLAIVSFLHAADPRDMMRHGTPQWILVLFGIVTFPIGMCLWNGLGLHFGLGQAKGRVNRAAAICTFLILLTLILVEVVVGAR